MVDLTDCGGGGATSRASPSPPLPPPAGGQLEHRPRGSICSTSSRSCPEVPSIWTSLLRPASLSGHGHGSCILCRGCNKGLARDRGECGDGWLHGSVLHRQEKAQSAARTTTTRRRHRREKRQVAAACCFADALRLSLFRSGGLDADCLSRRAPLMTPHFRPPFLFYYDALQLLLVQCGASHTAY